MTEDRRYCIYFHKRATDNSLFYIGSGVQGKREYVFTGRSKQWNDVAKACGVSVEVFKSNLTLDEARSQENDLIEENADCIVNVQRNSLRDVDVSYFTQYVKYDESSPTFLTWIQSTGMRSKIGNAAGAVAHVKGKPRHSSLTVKGRTTSISRLIWTMFNGPITNGMVIDHIDGDHSNNNICNLRCVTTAENNRNARHSSHKRGLPVGVYLEKANYRASCSMNGVLISSSFSILKYGDEGAFKLACEWRDRKLTEANLLGSGYTSCHFTGQTALCTESVK